MQASDAKTARNEPTVVYSDSDHVTCVLANLVISFSLAEPSRPYFENWTASATKLTTSYPLIATMVVIDSSAKPPSEAVRTDIKRVMGSLRETLVACAFVIEGTGFVAAAKRSALSMIVLLARAPYPIRFFSNVRDAAPWLIGKLGGSNPANLDAAALIAAAESVRRART